MGSGFLISMAPVASALASTTGGDLSGFSYFDLDAQAVSASGAKLVTFYNAQFYSGFGDASSPTGYNNIIAAGWDPARVVLGVLDASSDGSGAVALGTLENTINSLKAKYGANFGGVDGWEYFNAGSSDAQSNPWKWVKAVAGSVNGAVSRVRRGAGNYISRSTLGSSLVEKRDTEAQSLNAADYPRAPFPTADILGLVNSGASWFEAVRALNLTDGDVGAATSLYTGVVASRVGGLLSGIGGLA